MGRRRSFLSEYFFRGSTASALRLTIILFIGTLSAALLTWGAIDHFDRRFASEQSRLRAENVLGLAEIWLASFLADYAQSLDIIASSTTFTRAVQDPDYHGDALRDFGAWLAARPAISQLRYIDSTGREVLRTERVNEQIVAVPQADLQDKASRYYFQTTIGLPQHALYLSPIDLNVEFGRIETPWRPVVRLALPIYGSSPEARGILIMNLDAGSILEAIEDMARPLGQPVQLLNAQGYWLSGAREADLFGFMFDNDQTLARQDPALWSQVRTAHAGTILQDRVQTSYISLPLADLIRSRTTYDSVSTREPTLYMLVDLPLAAGLFSSRNIPGIALLIVACAAFSIYTATMIAGRKRAEEQARASEAQVIRLDRMAGLGALVASVSHELNTPIGNALMTATTVDHRASELSRSVSEGRIGRNSLFSMVSDIREGVSMMTASLYRASEIIGSFKQFAIDQTSDRRRSFELKDYLQETLKLLKPQFTRSGITLAAGDIAAVTMESFPGPLGQVVTNLLINARVHGFKGRSRGVVKVSAKRVGSDHVAIIVSDNGHGMTPEQLRKALDPFFTTAVADGGSGLGLTIVNNIVGGVLHGKLDIESTPDQGTSVTLLIPIVAPSGNGQFTN